MSAGVGSYTPKPGDLSWATLTFKPAAYCADCNWSLSVRPWHESPQIVAEAKRHAVDKPGHTTFIDRLKRTTYSLPSSVLLRLGDGGEPA